MAILAKSSGSTFTPCPIGTYQAVCVDVVDHGLIEVTFNGHTRQQHKVSLVWVTNEINPENDKPFLVQRRFTNSLNEKSALRPFLEGWRGKPFSAEELKGFDLEKLIGVNGLISVIHRTSDDGRVWANVTSVGPLMRGMAKIVVPPDYVRRKDREPEAQQANGGSDLPDVDVVFTSDDESVPF